jgi:hypothetical protein
MNSHIDKVKKTILSVKRLKTDFLNACETCVNAEKPYEAFESKTIADLNEVSLSELIKTEIVKYLEYTA